MEQIHRFRGERRLWGKTEWMEMLREDIEDTVRGLWLAERGFPDPLPDPEQRPLAALARAYAKGGVQPGELAAWEERREAGEDISVDLRALAAVRGTPWDAGCAIPALDPRTDEQIAADDWEQRRRLHEMLGFRAVPVDGSGSE